MNGRALMALVALAVPSPALAFHPLLYFADSVEEGGGGGVYFTGSPRWNGYDCTLCHVHAARAIRMVVTSSPPELIERGRWTAGQRYRLQIELRGEHGKNRTNPNSFVAELLDERFAPRGTLSGQDLQPVPAAPGVVAGVAGQNQLRWSVELIPPEPGAGALTLYLAGVDGDGAGAPGDASAALDTDPLGDDVFVGRWRFCEADTDCDPSYVRPRRVTTSPAALGCRAGAGAAGSPAWALALLAALLTRRARSGGPRAP